MRRLIAIVLALTWAACTASAGPSRVVSMNLCTDQLAMMLAGPGQLISVTYLARDRRASAMAEDAMAYPVNHGLAEEIYLLKPDLVIAGAYTTRATTDMLRRLGIPVVVFQPANSLDEVRDRLLQMGEVLGREAEARALAQEYTTRLTALRAQSGDRPRAALYSANGYTSGDRSLAGGIMQAAGLDNIAAELGYDRSGILPLELLALSEPEMLIGSAPYPGASHAEEVMAHPVVRHLASKSGAGEIRDADWICGTPHVVQAVVALSAERRAYLDKKGLE